MRNLTTVKAPELRKAALAALEAQEDQWSAFWRLPAVVASQLGGDMRDKASLNARYDWDVSPAMDNWTGRVRRVLNALADEGAIARVRKGQQTPWEHEASEAMYFTLSAYAQAQGEAEARRAEVTAYALAWGEIQQRLEEGAGVRLAPSGTLSQDDWQKLLEKAGW